jgi:hypothetical protein
MSKFMFESSKTVRQSIFADFYFRQTRWAFTLIELLVVIATHANARFFLLGHNCFQNVTCALRGFVIIWAAIKGLTLRSEI